MTGTPPAAAPVSQPAERGWLKVFGVAVIVVTTAGYFAIPLIANHRAIAAIERAGGDVGYRRGGPMWLRAVCGNRTMQFLGFDVVETIVLWDCFQASDSLMPYVAQMKETKHLILSGTPVTDAGLEHLTPLSKLETLQLRGTKVSGGGIAKLSSLHNLWMLNLNSSSVTDKDLVGVSKVHTLRVLALNHTEITDAGMATLTTMPNLELLRIIDTRVTGAGLQTLTGSPKLECLILHVDQLATADPDQLADISKLQSIAILGIHSDMELWEKFPTLVRHSCCKRRVRLSRTFRACVDVGLPTQGGAARRNRRSALPRAVMSLPFQGVRISG